MNNFVKLLSIQCKRWSLACNCKRSFSNGKSKQTDLLKQIKSKIQFSGPITVAEYMKEALTNPACGYYMKKDVFGSEGDFITSPEISQVFGELIAVWFVYEWKKMGQCKPLHIIELGPGRGTLANDMLRTISNLVKQPNFVSLHLVEISPHLRDIQRKTLCGDVSISSMDKPTMTRYNIPVQWYDHLTDVPKAFSCILAHEFLDALPIHKLVKIEENWREVLIDIDDGGGPHHLRYVLSRGPTPISKLFSDKNEPKDQVEICPQAKVITNELCIRIKENGGCALIGDYGHCGEKGDTFRGFKKHEIVDPLLEPGLCDLTADVDFKSLAEEAAKICLPFGPVTQNVFLKNLGIELRIQNLMKNCSPEASKDLISSYENLTDPSKMGERFKFLVIFPKVMQDFLEKCPPTGF